MNIRNIEWRSAAVCAVVSLLASACTPAAWATDYYVDVTNGVDTNDGTSTATPWKTLAKVNAYFSASASAPNAIEAGDTVNFKRGSVWDEPLVIRRSGTGRAWIVLQPYGDSGDAPTIRGSVAVGTGMSGWTADGSRWKTTVGVPADVRQVMFTRSGTTTVLPFARYPNIGTGQAAGDPMLRTVSAQTCLSAGAYSSTTQTTADFNASTCGLVHEADSMLATQDLNGADVIIRDGQYRFDRRRIQVYDAGTATMTWVTGTVVPSTPVIYVPVTYNLDNENTGNGVGYGFYVAGKAWMIDQAGEWAVETVKSPLTRTLYLKTPDGMAPAADSVRVTAAASGTRFKGIDAEGSSFVIINGLQVVDATTGLELSNTSNMEVTGVRVLRSVQIGIRGDGAYSLSLTHNWIEQSAIQGIAAQGTTDLTISDNDIIAVGTHLPPDGDTIATWPNSRNQFGIYALLPNGATISGNRLANNAYVGIFAGWTSDANGTATVSDNTLLRSCVYLDDCGALYTGGRSGLDTGLTFSGNYVLDVLGSEVGRPYDALGRKIGNSAQGIYLDDFSKNVLVDANLVVNAQNGMQVHLGRYNTVQNNIFVANRASEIWFYESRRGTQLGEATGTAICPDVDNCLVSNTVTANFYVGMPLIPANILQSDVGDTTDFASFDDNLYANVFTGFAVQDHGVASGVPQPWVTYSWPQWQSMLGQDTNSVLASARLAIMSGYTGALGSTLLSNGDFSASTTGWETWAASGTPPLSTANTSGVNGNYARFQAAAGPGDSILNTNTGFAVTSGRKYLLRFAVRSEGSTVNAYSALRILSGLAGLSTNTSFTATSDWQIVTVQFTASGTADGVGGNPLARLDFQIPAGSVLDIDDLQLAEMVELTNLVTNGDFNAGIGNWYLWAPSGQSLTFDAGQFATLLGSPTNDSVLNTTADFGVQAGKQYLLRFAMRSQGATTSAFAGLRRASDYISISQAFTFTATSTWQYFYTVLNATETADGSGSTPHTSLYFEMPPGSALELDDVLVSELNATAVTAGSLLHAFPGGPVGAGSYNCPDAGTAGVARCTAYVNLRTGLPISWPLIVPQLSVTDTVVAVVLDALFKDSDGDGVADVNDLCPLTPANTKVDERGCSYAQRHL